jgi:hypothetical protein
MQRESEHLANALTMLPFAYLSMTSVDMALRSTITFMWIAAMNYHIQLYLRNRGLASRLFLCDTISQVVSLIVLVRKSSDYTDLVKTTYTYIGLAGIFTILFLTHPYTIPFRSKAYVHLITVLAHISNMSLSWSFAQRRLEFYKSFVSFISVAMTFIGDEVGISYIWSFGHIICLFYTMFSWKALGVLV